MAVQRILVATDGSHTSRAAVVWSCALARSVGGEVVLMHAFDINTFYPATAAMPVYLPIDTDEMRARARADVADWAQPLHDAGIPYHTLLRDGRPADAILDVAGEEQVDLIVMGTRGHGGFTELLMGSVAHAVSHHANVPVVMIPPRAATGVSAAAGCIDPASAAYGDAS